MIRACFSPRISSGIPEEEHTLEKSRVVVLPVPYERTVSYGVGTKNGPAAIVEASHYVELYDDELDEETYRIGIHTLPPWLPENMEPASCVEELEAVVARPRSRQDKFVLTLGGEHSIARGPIAAHRARYPGLSDPPLRRPRRPARRVRGRRSSPTPAPRAAGSSSTCRRSRSASGRSRREEVDFVRQKGTIRVVSNREMHRSDDWMEGAFRLLCATTSTSPSTWTSSTARSSPERARPSRAAAPTTRRSRILRRLRRRREAHRRGRRRRARSGARKPGARLHDRQALLQAPRPTRTSRKRPPNPVLSPQLEVLARETAHGPSVPPSARLAARVPPASPSDLRTFSPKPASSWG